MFRVSAVLRRYDADRTCRRDGRRRLRITSLRPSMSVIHAGFCGGGTQHNPLSAAIAKTRMENACGGPERRYSQAHLVNQRFVIVDVPYTRATSRGSKRGRRGSFCLSGHDKRVRIGESSAMETFLKYLSMVSRERLGSPREPAEPCG